MKKNGKVRKTVCMMALLGMTASFVIMNTGTGAEAATGTWKHDSKGWWYSYGKGSYAANEWVKYDGKWYYFGSDGYMVDGWKKIDGKWYFFRKGVMQNGWQKIGDKWYYFVGGAMQNGWRKISGKWYFFASGAMQTGWLEYKDKYYYFTGEGCMVTGKTTIDGLTLNFSSDGELLDDVCFVPDLSTYVESQIRTVLLSAGLKPGTITRTHDSSHSDGDVISQTPQAGKTVKKGSAVDFIVCDNTFVTLYRYKEVVEWEHTTTTVNSAPGSGWVKEKNPTTEGDVTTYYWKKAVWSDWSEWSTKKAKPGNERQVETKEQYLY